MRIAWLLLSLVSIIAPATASASRLYLFGGIGDAPIMAAVEQDGAKISGWYYYLRTGGDLQLEGQIAANGDLSLVETVDGKATGAFEGKAAGSVWSGEWRKAGGGAPVAFALTQTSDTLSLVSGQFACASSKQDKTYGWTYHYALKLALASGKVKALDASASATSKQGDDQGCYYSLDLFRQAPAKVGALLMAKDDQTPDDPEAQHCTIRIVGDGDYLYVEFGDVTEKNNDCRFTSERAFCSPRSWMSDFIVDRKKRTCRPVGN